MGKNASSAFSLTSRSLGHGGMVLLRSGTGQRANNPSNGSVEPAHVQHFCITSKCFLQMCSSGQYFLWLWRPCSPAPAWLPHVSCLPKVLHGGSELQVRQGHDKVRQGETRTRQCIQNIECSLFYHRWTVSVPPSQLLLLRLLDLQLRSPPPGSGWEHGTC